MIKKIGSFDVAASILCILCILVHRYTNYIFIVYVFLFPLFIICKKEDRFSLIIIFAISPVMIEFMSWIYVDLPATPYLFNVLVRKIILLISILTFSLLIAIAIRIYFYRNNYFINIFKNDNTSSKNYIKLQNIFVLVLMFLILSNFYFITHDNKEDVSNYRLVKKYYYLTNEELLDKAHNGDIEESLLALLVLPSRISESQWQDIFINICIDGIKEFCTYDYLNNFYSHYKKQSSALNNRKNFNINYILHPNYLIELQWIQTNYELFSGYYHTE